MPTEYYYVSNPSAADISNSVHKSDSPSVKRGTDETLLLTYTNGYVPSGGHLEYHADKQQQFDGKTKDSVNKNPDPFAMDDLSRRGKEVARTFWFGLSLGVTDRIALHDHVDEGLHFLEFGDTPAARHVINGLSTTSQFTSAMKTSLLNDIDAILDDYDHLK